MEIARLGRRLGRVAYVSVRQTQADRTFKRGIVTVAI